MNTTPDVQHVLREWFADDADVAPDRILDVVADRIARQPQRIRSRPGRRVANRYLRLAAGVAAATVLAVVGWNLLPRNESVGAPTPAPTDDATPRTDVSGELEPGTYLAHPLPAPHQSLTVRFTVPDGWAGVADAGGVGLALVPVGDPGTGSPDGIAIQFVDVTTLNGDPCRWLDRAGDIAVGPAVADLVRALEAQTAYEVSVATDITIGGYAGKRVDIVAPSEPFAGQSSTARACDNDVFRLWSTTAQGEGGIYVQGPANRWQTHILDVAGTRLVVVVQDFPGTSRADRAALDGIVASIVIEP